MGAIPGNGLGLLLASPRGPYVVPGNNPCWPHARQIPCPQYYCSGPHMHNQDLGKKRKSQMQTEKLSITFNILLFYFYYYYFHWRNISKAENTSSACTRPRHAPQHYRVPQKCVAPSDVSFEKYIHISEYFTKIKINLLER